MEDYLKAQADGTAFELNGNDGEGVNIEILTAAKTLTGADSDKTFILGAAVGYAITLPAVAMKGWRAKFITGLAFATTNWTIVAATKVIQGSVIVNSTDVPGSNEDTVTFVDSAESLGDWVELVSDGTNWYISGLGHTTGSITLTAS